MDHAAGLAKVICEKFRARSEDGKALGHGFYPRNPLRVTRDRAKEPSTWAGLAGLAMVFGVNAEQWQTIGTAVAAAIAMFVSEAK